ncbi:pentapeptide repeat family protein [Vibrio maritimus]|uniref:Pentapeptide repeat family protein n=1 Tax=Vibrio maritimus TaxID=990268 RepID=A0A090SNC6_9VIBR|nr:pentapeptide repeat family protein [Vibrio maritimus]
MKTDHEFAYFKANTDVLVFGKARSYAKKPTTQHECRVLLDGHIDKTLKIMGERVWIEHGGGVTVSRPIEFIEREIDYSNAVGEMSEIESVAVLQSRTQYLYLKWSPLFSIQKKIGRQRQIRFESQVLDLFLRFLMKEGAMRVHLMKIG